MGTNPTSRLPQYLGALKRFEEKTNNEF